jgi:hypothetical protein
MWTLLIIPAVDVNESIVSYQYHNLPQPSIRSTPLYHLSCLSRTRVCSEGAVREGVGASARLCPSPAVLNVRARSSSRRSSDRARRSNPLRSPAFESPVVSRPGTPAPAPALAVDANISSLYISSFKYVTSVAQDLAYRLVGGAHLVSFGWTRSRQSTRPRSRPPRCPRHPRSSARCRIRPRFRHVNAQNLCICSLPRPTVRCRPRRQRPRPARWTSGLPPSRTASRRSRRSRKV